MICLIVEYSLIYSKTVSNSFSVMRFGALDSRGGTLPDIKLMTGYGMKIYPIFWNIDI